MAEIRTVYFPNTSHESRVSRLQHVQFLLTVPIEMQTRDSIQSNRRTGNCVVSEENVDKKKGDAL
jgi:hypothetical protein